MLAAESVRGARRWWLLPLILGTGSITAGVLAAPAVLVHPTYAVSVPVPEARSQPYRKASFSRGRTARREREGVGLAHATPGRGPSEAAAVDGLTAEAQERRFTAIAMRTGEMQSWQTGEIRYFLVAGDLQPTAEGGCRAFSLLARPAGGGDSVRQFERCGSTD